MLGARKLAVLLTALALSGAAVASAAAAPGDLDPTFGVGGKALVDLGGYETGTSLALQPDGRIIAGGSTNAINSAIEDGVVARILSPQGTLDPSYGGGSGWSRLDFGGLDFVTGVAQQPDGRIVATVKDLPAGTPHSFVVRLLNPDGTRDPAFGAGAGFVEPPLLPGQYLSAVVLQPDARIVVAGDGDASPGRDMTVARILGTGLLDPGYGLGYGWSRVAFPQSPGQLGSTNAAAAVALQPDGRIVVAGLTTAGAGGGAGNIAVARLLSPEGTYDPSFGSAGNGRVRIVPGPAHISHAAAVAVQPDGGIVLAGGSGPGEKTQSAALVRLLPSGAPDPGFSGDGVALSTAGGSDTFNAVALQPDGKIVAAGSTGPLNGPTDILAMRFQPGGTPDTTFGVGGRVVLNLGGSDLARALALQPDGRIVLLGSTSAGTGDIVVARLQGDPPAGPGGSGGSGGAGGPAGAPTCAGRTATIVGTPGRDRLKGTPTGDVIAGLGGDDVIAGLAGDDVICGGPGADRLTGGAGADRLLGGAGADRILGGAGADRLLGGPGADRLVGGGGRDALLGGPGRNVRVQ